MHSSSHHTPVWTHLGTQQRCLAVGTQTIHTQGPCACKSSHGCPGKEVSQGLSYQYLLPYLTCHPVLTLLTSAMLSSLAPRRGDFVPRLHTSHPMYHTHHIHTTHIPHTVHTRYTYYTHTTYLVQKINCIYSTDLLYTYHRSYHKHTTPHERNCTLHMPYT